MDNERLIGDSNKLSLLRGKKGVPEGDAGASDLKSFCVSGLSGGGGGGYGGGSGGAAFMGGAGGGGYIGGVQNGGGRSGVRSAHGMVIIRRVD